MVWLYMEPVGVILKVFPWYLYGAFARVAEQNHGVVESSAFKGRCGIHILFLSALVLIWYRVR